jgi:outer membrane protein OmpA-like peptidoglycan-associated protein
VRACRDIRDGEDSKPQPCDFDVANTQRVRSRSHDRRDGYVPCSIGRGVRSSRSPVVVLAALVLLVMLVTGLANVARADGLDGQRFVPAAGAAGGFVVERAIVPRHLGWGLGAFVSYGHRPVVVRDRGRDVVVARPLEHAMSVDAVGSIGLGGFFELAGHVPIRAIHSGDEVAVSGQVLRASGGLGDVRVVPKFAFLDRGDEDLHFTLGAAIPVSLPTGTGRALRGSDGVGIEPRLLFGFGGGRWDVALSGGYLLRPGNDTNLAGDREITFGAAGTINVAKGSVPIDLQLEVWGAHLPNAKTDGRKTPLESLLGLILWPTEDLSIYAGAGPGLTTGLTAPDVRAAIGIRYARNVPGRDRYRDRDGDGIPNDRDKCPDTPEDKDGFEDDDGCPEPDNDHDGIRDDDDECPQDPEEVGGDGDGCPDKARVIIEDGHIIVIGKVQFESGSARISPKSQQLVDEVAIALKGHPEFKNVEIEGHTDSTGPVEFNDKLSKERAESVKQALVERGVDPKRLQTEGYGPHKPMAPNDTPAGRARNRRVEFTVKK